MSGFARVAAFVLFFVSGATAANAQSSVALGHTIYLVHCASCHAVDLRGGADGPPLRGVGAAAVDFWVGTGRMPAAVPWVDVQHKTPLLSARETAALVAYVTHAAPGGAPIPQVIMSNDIERGRRVFEDNCEHCHGAFAQGNAIGAGFAAPALDQASVTQIAEAIRTGPGNMPRFSEQTIPQSDLDAVASYVNALQTKPDHPGGITPLGDAGPVEEGIVAWVFAMGALVAFSKFLGTNE